MEDFKIVQYVTDLAVEIAPKIALALLALIVGFWIVKRIVNVIKGQMTRSNIDPSLQPFLLGIVGVLLKVVLLISIAAMLGVETTSFVAIIGAAGLAVGLALQGSLANFAGGVLILIFKPFKVGDVIETQGHTGGVHSIQIFNTVLKTPDNKTVILANGPVAGGSIVNYSTEPTRRLDLTIGISYDDDIAKAREELWKIIKAEGRILTDKAPQVLVSELADSSVNFSVRLWVNGGDYWPLHFELTEKIKIAFDAAKISFPYPQMDVHMDKVN